jgi:hypothetical protein
MFSILQSLLGFQPDAPNGKLYVDPALPEWLPDLTVRDLQLGRESFDILFTRTSSGTDYQVLKGPADRVLRRPMTAAAALLRNARLVGQ